MRPGDIGTEVRDLQNRLKRAGYSVTVDSVYGEETAAAVRQVQAQYGLVQDGIAGKKTLEAMAQGSTAPHRLTHAAIEQAAERLGVQVAAVLAVNEVESQGSGFLDDGTARPKILYERHVMYRLLKAKGIDADELSRQYPNLVSTQRGGYSGGAAEHTRLALACAIDRECALMAASWGAFQILGENFEACGWDSIDAFVRDLSAGEEAQFRAFIGFIEADQALLKALRARKWADFAKGYNGPAYKDNLYDVKMARAYERHVATFASEAEAA